MLEKWRRLLQAVFLHEALELAESSVTAVSTVRLWTRPAMGLAPETQYSDLKGRAWWAPGPVPGRCTVRPPIAPGAPPLPSVQLPTARIHFPPIVVGMECLLYVPMCLECHSNLCCMELGSDVSVT